MRRPSGRICCRIFEVGIGAGSNLLDVATGGLGVGLSLLCGLYEPGGCGAYCLGFTREKGEREGMREAKFRAEMTVELVRGWRTR